MSVRQKDSNGNWVVVTGDSTASMVGATASTDGEGGLVPKPSAGDQNKFLKGDGTFDDVPDPQVMTGATSSDAGTSGLTPIPSAGSEDKVLQGNGTWGHKLQIDIVEQNGVYGYINGSDVFVPFKSQADIDAAVAAARVGTATAADVLAGKTFTNENQSGVTGSMVDNAAATNAVSIGTNGTNTYHRIPTGAYLKLQGTGYPEIVTPLTEYGNASASDVVSGKTFTSSAGLKASGTAPSRGSSGQAPGNKCWKYSNRVYFGVDYGWYPSGSTFGGMSNVCERYVDYANVASAVGVTASTVRAGSTVLGVKGNDTSGTYTYASGSTGGTVDMGTTNNYRYVNASNVYNKGKSDGQNINTYEVLASSKGNSGGDHNKTYKSFSFTITSSHVSTYKFILLCVSITGAYDRSYNDFESLSITNEYIGFNETTDNITPLYVSGDISSRLCVYILDNLTANKTISFKLRGAYVYKIIGIK